VRVMWGMMKTVKKNSILCADIFSSGAPIGFEVVFHSGKQGIHCVQSFLLTMNKLQVKSCKLSLCLRVGRGKCLFEISGTLKIVRRH
jgi:hypothetical protein